MKRKTTLKVTTAVPPKRRYTSNLPNYTETQTLLVLVRVLIDTANDQVCAIYDFYLVEAEFHCPLTLSDTDTC